MHLVFLPPNAPRQVPYPDHLLTQPSECLSIRNCQQPVNKALDRANEPKAATLRPMRHFETQAPCSLKMRSTHCLNHACMPRTAARCMEGTIHSCRRLELLHTSRWATISNAHTCSTVAQNQGSAKTQSLPLLCSANICCCSCFTMYVQPACLPYA